MNGNLWVWEQGAPQNSVPALPATGAGEGSGDRNMVRAWRRAPKKVTPWGVTRQGDAAPVASASFMFSSPLTTLRLWSPFCSSCSSKPSFWDIHMGRIFEREEELPFRRAIWHLKQDPNGGIQPDHLYRRTIRPIIDLSLGMLGKRPRSQSAVRLPPGRTTSSRSAFGVGEKPQRVPLRYQTHIIFRCRCCQVLLLVHLLSPLRMNASRVHRQRHWTKEHLQISACSCLPSSIFSSPLGTLLRILRRSGIEQGAVGDAVSQPVNVRDLWARSSWGSGGRGVRGVRTVATYVNGPRDIWGNFNIAAVVAARFLNTAKGAERDAVVSVSILQPRNLGCSSRSANRKTVTRLNKTMLPQFNPFFQGLLQVRSSGTRGKPAYLTAK